MCGQSRIQRPGPSHPGQVPSFFHYIAVPQSDRASPSHLHSCDQMLSLLLQNEVYMVQEKWHLPNADTHLKAGEREREKERKRERERETPVLYYNIKYRKIQIDVKTVYNNLAFFFNKFIYSFIIYCVFVAACGLSLVVVSGGYSSLRCAGFSLRCLLLLWSVGLLRWLLLLLSTGSRHASFSSCSTWAQ